MKNAAKTIITAVLIIAAGIAGYLIFRDKGAAEPGGLTEPGNIQGNIQNNAGEAAGESKKGYYFEYKGVEIVVNDPAEPILEKLGEPMHYFEAPSCAFEGMDKIYSYSGFDLQTYTKDGSEYVFSVLFMDDSVTTREGIGLNATLEQITEAYGPDYENEFNQYSYFDGNCRISFLLENNEVISVEYSSTAGH